MESIFEEDSQLRRVVEGELVINALTPDQALKVRELVISFYYFIRENCWRKVFPCII